MWGICFDVSICESALFHRAVEYETEADGLTAVIMSPVKDIKISVDKIKTADKPPVFAYGDLAVPVSHPDLIGKIEEIIWHFKKNTYGYYISVKGRKKKTRYFADDLMKMEITDIEMIGQESDNDNCYDDNIDVIFELSDGSAWCATFFTYQNLTSLSSRYRETGECLSGEYFYAHKPIFISRIDKSLIVSVIKDIIYNDGIGAFEKIEE